MGVVLQAQQSVLRVIEDTLLDAQFGPWGATDCGLSGGPVLHRETGTDVANRDCLDVSWNVTQSAIFWFRTFVLQIILSAHFLRCCLNVFIFYIPVLCTIIHAFIRHLHFAMCWRVSNFILLNYVYVSILHKCTNGNYLCLVIILEKVVSGLYQVPRVQSLTQQTEWITYVCDELWLHCPTSAC